MARWVVALAAILVAACDPPMPLSSAEENSSGRQFSPPPNGEAALYLFGRGGGKFTMTANRLQLGDVTGQHWLRVDLPPGRYDVRCASPALSLDPGDLLLQLNAGDVKYASVRISLGTGSCRLTEETPAAAQPAILAGQRARDLR